MTPKTKSPEDKNTICPVHFIPFITFPNGLNDGSKYCVRCYKELGKLILVVDLGGKIDD